MLCVPPVISLQCLQYMDNLFGRSELGKMCEYGLGPPYPHQVFVLRLRFVDEEDHGRTPVLAMGITPHLCIQRHDARLIVRSHIFQLTWVALVFQLRLVLRDN